MTVTRSAPREVLAPRRKHAKTQTKVGWLKGSRCGGPRAIRRWPCQRDRIGRFRRATSPSSSRWWRRAASAGDRGASRFGSRVASSARRCAARRASEVRAAALVRGEEGEVEVVGLARSKLVEREQVRLRDARKHQRVTHDRGARLALEVLRERDASDGVRAARDAEVRGRASTERVERCLALLQRHDRERRRAVSGTSVRRERLGVASRSGRMSACRPPDRAARGEREHRGRAGRHGAGDRRRNAICAEVRKR